MTNANDEAKNLPPYQAPGQDYFQVLCNATDQGLCLVELVFDQTGKLDDLIVRQYNQAFDQQAGLSNVVGKAYSQILPQFETYWFEAYTQVANTGESIQMEQYVQDLDRWIRTKFSRVGPLGSRLVAVAFDDMTSIKKRELALLEADRRKDEFLAMLGHELRNPLGVVANTLTYLELSGGEDPELSYPAGVQRMSRQVRHLGRMVDDLLEVSRIRQGKIRLLRQRLELGPLVTQTVEAARSLFSQYERRLEVALPAEPLVVDGDATRLAQLMMNLLGNAAKYTEEGGHIWISLEREYNQAVLRVKDDGKGIATEELTAIFEVFVQGETSIDRPQGGLGLGLAVAKQIAEGHQGQIQAHSGGPGQGSEFILHLPLLTPDPETTSSGAQAQAPPKARERVRVLIVDDNRELIDLMGKIMQRQGYEVHLRYSGQTGIEAAESLKPDVVLLDIGMPHLDGYAVCAHIRGQAWGKPLPIIALTGFGREADKQRSWAAGFDGHVLKPVDYASLPELIAKTMAAKKEEQADRSHLN